MSRLTWNLVRDLAGFCASEPRALSFYVRLDPSESPTPQALSTRFNSLLTQVEKTYLSNGEESGAKSSIRNGLDRVREWVESEFDRDGARGVAVFVSADDDFWRVVRIADPVDDHVEVDRQFAVAPLVHLVRDDEIFVAQVDRERGTVFRLVDGHLEEVADESDEVPGRHDQGGWSQARYQRHIEKLVRDHLKTVGGELEGELRRSGSPRVVVVAPDGLRSEIEAQLSPETRDTVVGWARAEPHSTPAELLAVVQPILAEAREAADRDELERWREQLGRHDRASSGWEDTLEAASDARVELLLANRASGGTAYRCPECLRAAAGPGTCPLDGTPLEEHDALELAVHRAPEIAGTPKLAEAFRAHLAETEGHERAIAQLLEARDEAPSWFKDAVMKLGGKGFVLFAKASPDTPGKLLAHALSYEALEEASYALLANVAERAGDVQVAETAERIRREEVAMKTRLEGCFDDAVDASLAAVGNDDLDEQLSKYLADAHALEQQAIGLLERASERDSGELADAYRRHLAETREHADALAARLEARGSDPSTLKDTFVRMGAFSWATFFEAHPDTPGKRAAFAYAFEHLEIGGYEQLERVAKRAGDAETADLAARILEQERIAADSLEHLFPHAAGLALAASAGR